MMPAALVSALVFAHPEFQYFAVEQIVKDQVESYSQREKYDLSPMERWLSPILNYDREYEIIFWCSDQLAWIEKYIIDM